MPTLIAHPTRIEAAGNKPKLIDEYVGRVNSETADLSIAHMRSPGGWEEPGQRPEFDEFTVVVKGVLRVEHEDGPRRLLHRVHAIAQAQLDARSRRTPFRVPAAVTLEAHPPADRQAVVAALEGDA